jgi:hypothetical protein
MPVRPPALSPELRTVELRIEPNAGAGYRLYFLVPRKV